MNYEHKYTWQHIYDNSVVIHTDGTCSVMVTWDGLDTELATPEESNARFLNLYRFIDKLPFEITAEWHLWREHDVSLARNYWTMSDRIKRSHKIALHFRKELANHLAQYSYTNQIGLVLTWHKTARSFFSKRVLVKQGQQAERLLSIARQLIESLPGARVRAADEYIARINQSINRDNWSANLNTAIQPEFFLNEQLVPGKPVIENGLLRLGDHYSKVVLLYLYPDAFAGISAVMTRLFSNLHVSHIIRRIDVKAAMRASEKAEKLSAGTTSHTGLESKTSKIGAEIGFRRTVHDNNYQIFSNTYLLHLHNSNAQELHQDVRKLVEVIDSLAGSQLRMTDDIQLPFWRFGQPGQGYKSTWARRDHTQQVGDMLPVQVPDHGVDNPMALRLSSAGNLVGFSFLPDQVNHSFTAAMTGAGKGVNKVAQILETYPLGVDWYIMEVGTSYQWTVEALGGTYTRIDPGETVVNPLPLYSDAIHSKEYGVPVLPIEMMTGTVESLAFILTDTMQLSTAQAAVGQGAFNVMYAAPEEGTAQPTFEHLLGALQMADGWVNNETERTEAKRMAERLESFLSTAEGRIFAQPNNFTLSEGITGVDLLLVRNKAKRLLKFYLVFLSLAFTQRAFASQHRSRVLLDEMHEYVRVAPDVIKPLITGLARMGRKDGASLDLVTQETEEIDQIERAVINQCPWQTFLYRQADWELIAERTNMPAAALARWRSYDNPLQQPFRPALQKVGDSFYDLMLTFPEDLLLLASSDKSILDAKAVIGKDTTDPFERLAKLKTYKEADHEAA